MKRSNFQHMGLVLEKVFKDLGFEKKMKELEIKENWKLVVGPVFDKATKKLLIYNKVLYVTVDSSAIRNELIMNRSKIIERLNEIVNQIIIVEMIVK